MARKSRLFIQELPHLVQLQGHNGAPLFIEDADYSAFEKYLEQAARRYEVAIYSWSLAPERILLLLSAPDKQSLSRFIQHVGRSYVPWYNHRYQRRGSLWEGRYLCSPLEPEVYFLAVKRFIECDPCGVPGSHSLGGLPAGKVAQHQVWLKLGDDETKRQARFQDFCRTPANAALTSRIHSALKQNCLLATPGLSQKLEDKLERPLRARRSGRPRKHDINPVERWTWLEQLAELFLRQRGYQQVRLALLERAPLFAPGGPTILGDGELRGDGTTGFLRLVAANQHQRAMSRVWYSGAIFHQPQGGGRLQQNHQIGVETFGMPGINIELELLLIQSVFFQRIKLGEQVELHLNMLGDAQSLAAFRQALRDYYHPLTHLLEPEQKAWLTVRPEWLIHHEDILLQRLSAGAPRLEAFVSADDKRRFKQLQQGLNQAGIAWQHDPLLFPGNDYCQLVFEWRSTAPGNEYVISRGGRYDAYASRILGHPAHACGFAFMLEPVMTLLNHLQARHNVKRQVDIAIIPDQPRAAVLALLLGRRLRQQFPQLSILNDCSRLHISTRYRNSCRLGVRFILKLGDNGESLQLYDVQRQRCEPSSLDTITSQIGQAMML